MKNIEIAYQKDAGFAGSPSYGPTIQETDADICLTVGQEFFLSANPLALDGLAVAARTAATHPDRAETILTAVYEKWGPGDALKNALETRVRALGLDKEEIAADIDYAIGTGREKLGLRALVGAIMKRQRQGKMKDTLIRVTERVAEADPYYTMADSAVRSVAMDEGGVLSTFVYADGRDQLTPTELPTYEASRFPGVIQSMIMKEIKNSYSAIVVGGISRRIGKVIQKTEGEARIFTRPRATVTIAKWAIRESGGSMVKIITSSDSEILAGVMTLYRAALAYVATEGRSSFPNLSHWQHLRVGRASRGSEEVPLVKEQGFEAALQHVVVKHKSDAQVASTLIRQTLGPVVARIIEERAQFPEDTAFPLTPRAILLRDYSGRPISLDKAVEQVAEIHRARLPRMSHGDLEYVQHQSAIALGEKIVSSLALCAGLFGKVSVEQMAGMYPLLSSGLPELRNEHALALSQAAGQTDAILGQVERVMSGNVDINLDAESTEYLQELSQALEGSFTISFNQIGETKQAKIPGDELYRILQDAKAPFELRKRVASFLLRKFVGYPPDLDKTPDILGKISSERKAELQNFRGSLPTESFTDIVSDQNFSPAEAKKMVRLRLKSVHPDVQIGSTVAGEATLLFNDLMAYLDELERERGEGLAATLKDI